MSRQEVAFLEECRKIKGCGSLREDFYTKFKPENKDLGLWRGGLKNVDIIVYRQILKCKREEFSLKEKEWGA